MTAEQRIEATQHLHSKEVQAKRMESLAQFHASMTAAQLSSDGGFPSNRTRRGTLI